MANQAITTLAVPSAKAVIVTAYLIEAGVAFAARPTSKGKNWEFAVEREDDDVLSRIAV